MNTTIHSTVLTPGPGYSATSATSLLIGTGNKTLATQAGLAYSIGARVRLAYSVDPTKFMEGVVTAWNTSTGGMTVAVDWVEGSGTFGAWNINLAGVVGAIGPQGPVGPQGVGYTPRGAYAGGTTYAQGDEVADGGVLYLSLQGSNTGHTPASSPTWWLSIGVGLLDSGVNGLLKRTALNTTAVAQPGVDYSTVWCTLSTVYIWSRVPGGALIVGSNPIAMGTLPAGLAVGNKIRISGGVGTDEAAEITAIAGANVTVTCGFTHSGGWSIGTATSGIQEAWVALGGGTTAGLIFVPAGSWPIYTQIKFLLNTVSLAGSGMLTTTLYSQFGAGDVLFATGGGYSFQFYNFSITNTYPATVTRTSGAYIHLKDVGTVAVENVLLGDAYIGVQLSGANSPYLHNVNVSTFELYGFYQLAAAGDAAVSGGRFLNNSAGGGATGSQAWRVEAQTGGSFAGFTNIGSSLQGADYLISCTGDGIINEMTWIGMTLDSARVGNIILSGTVGGSATKHKFLSFLYGGGGGGYLLSVNSKWSDVLIADFNGGCGVNGADITLAGCANVTIANAHMAGMDGQAQKVGIAIAADGAVQPSSIRLFNLKMGYGPGGQTTGYRFRNAIQLNGGTTITDLWCYDNQLIGDTAAINGSATLAGTIQIERNTGVDNVRPTIASAGTVTLSAVQFNPVVFVSGNTAIQNIAGAPVWDSKRITLIFTHPTPGGVATGGNIAAAVTVTQNRAVSLMWDSAAVKWFSLM